MMNSMFASTGFGEIRTATIRYGQGNEDTVLKVLDVDAGAPTVEIVELRTKWPWLVGGGVLLAFVAWSLWK